MRSFLRALVLLVPVLLLLVASTRPLRAEVVRIQVDRREPFAGGASFGEAGSYELIAGRVFFAVDPLALANQRIVDLRLAPRDARGRVLFSSDFVVLRPLDPAKARPSVLLEIINRGNTEENGPFFYTPGPDDFTLPTLDHVKFDDPFPFDQGFTFAYLGWETNPASGTMHLEAPTVDVSGPVRATFLTDATNAASTTHLIHSPLPGPCPVDETSPKLRILVKRAFDDPGSDPGPDLPVAGWHFTSVKNVTSGRMDCAISAPGALTPDRLYEVVFTAKTAPVAGLSFAAFRDFASYLKTAHGPDAPLLAAPASRVLGYGYSQSGRFLRSFLRAGFNTDERAHIAFDGLFISSAGAGGGSFNQRFANPDEAGTSVLCDLCPADLFPFSNTPETDPLTHESGGVLDLERAAHTIPKIVTTLSSSEYWTRFASLTYVTVDGRTELPLDPNERLYFTAGTPHGHAPFPPRKKLRATTYEQFANFAHEAPAFHALLLDLDEWIAHGTEPPPSLYPHLPRLVPRAAVNFPVIPGAAFPAFMPRTWRMDFGPRFHSEGIADIQPPKLGPEYTILVPQVDRDGNDLGGLSLPFLTVPLGTYTGWNRELPLKPWLNYLGGLRGSFIPFALTAGQRSATGDPRLSLAERYSSRQEFLDKTRAAAEALVARRLMLPRDIPAEVDRATKQWDFFTSPAPKTTSGTPIPAPGS